MTLTAEVGSGNSSLGLLSRIGGNNPLPVEQAFQLNVIATDRNTLNARWTITPDHHLYRSKIIFTVKSPAGTELGTPVFPEGKIIDDEFFGEMEIYDQSIDVQIPILKHSGDELVLETQYQGCSNTTGVCYPPVTLDSPLSLANLPEKAETPAAGTATDKGMAADEYFAGNFLYTLLIFFAVGLGLSFTPCIFPMIPILSGIIAGQRNLSAYKAFILSLTYVLASAVAYALIGLAFGFFGENLQTSLQ
ncbi:MAG: protein-disulfide reductase DsbD family protein, partial [Thiolinea sp.]